MAAFVVKTIPQGHRGIVLDVKDLTKEVYHTNDERMARSCVEGSAKPTAAFYLPSILDERGVPVSAFDNLARLNSPVRTRTASSKKLGKVQRIIEQALANERQRKPRPRRNGPETKREVIVERI